MQYRHRQAAIFQWSVRETHSDLRRDRCGAPLHVPPLRTAERKNAVLCKDVKTERVDINTSHDKLKEFVDVVVTKYPDVIRSPVIRDPSSKLFCRWML